MVARAQVALYHPSRLWRGYQRALKSSPVTTKSVTCMAAYALGDVMAQFASCKAPTLEKRILSMDAFRTARLALFGLLWTGPSGHAFYRWLDKAFLSMSFGRAISIAGKVSIDQLCYSPICTVVFLTWVNAACCTPEKIASDISQKLISSTKASWTLWTPCMVLNMALVPAQLRMLFINVISLFWTYKLSTMSASAAPQQKDIMEIAEEEYECTSEPCVAEILSNVSETDFVELVLNVEGTTGTKEDSLAVGIHQEVTVSLT